MKKVYTLFIVVLLASMVLSACQLGGSEPASTTPTPTSAPASVVATVAPSTSGPGNIVVTATGVTDLGSLLGNQSMTPQVGGTIQWDDMLKIPEWRKDTGLTGVDVLYAQSSVPDEIPLPKLNGEKVFTVPQNTVLIFGAYQADLKIANGKSYSFSGGFYGALTAGTVVDSLTVKNGFVLLTQAPGAQAEYCARIAQGLNEKWAMGHLYRPDSWKDPVCTGTITTVIDQAGQ